MIESFPVSLFGEERKIRVYLPLNKKEIKYPVLYMHDGQNVFGNEEAIGGVGLELHDYLEKNDVELIVVAIDQNSGDRVNEYCPWINGEYTTKLLGKPCSEGGKGKEYVEFIVNVLKPLIDSKYSTNPNQTYMAGISLGGLITTYAACTYPHIFKRIAGLSSGFYRNQEEIEQLLKTADLSHLEKVYLDCGTKEGGEKLAGPFLETNKAVFEIIRNKEVETELKVIEGAEHNYQAFKKRIPEVISYLLA
ncbi:alpha/beta hydrolase [Mesobacillus selenatarsenatis]|uniref:Putative alpha-dextrin endo-1, 6-alpha-glucosidase n=1 Tax=Mesobacillus selenatarsenatis (strain DSM 18680 / JCM 14380 / FERM P-15431 / SF-1) TaxID=1321606 RepID=A0A0A8WXP4_MESS1|nr:alpha/beta hydrolase-fold protein [Mesobacillus selenatarsenatis]GAM12425.1 putative alpha-dextrin endo-1, 6-alpha-glucosidase [Mesobacillus selenatarsenatis SF-1]